MGTWRKSTYSGSGGSCIEVADRPGRVGVRDTKEARLGNARTVIEFDRAAWRDFMARVRQGTAAQ